MKKLILVSFLCIPFFCQGQFFNIGFMGGLGFGGLKGNGMTIKTGINPEIGVMFKYNFTEKISIRTFVTGDPHKITLKSGKQVDIDYNNSTYTIIDAPDYSFGNFGVSQHLDLTYIVVEDKFDVSAGVFWTGRFASMVTSDQPRVFYAASNADILSQPHTPEVFLTQTDDEENITNLYASDQIQKAMRSVTGGVYIAASAGTKKLKAMVRYDLSLKNYYSKFSTSNKLKEGFFRIGLLYYMN